MLNLTGKKKSKMKAEDASASSTRSTVRKSSIQAKSLPQSTGPVSSESEDEEQEDGEKGLLRKVSTKKQLHSKACIKEGYLLKQMPLPFQRWRSRYFKLRPRRLFYAKHENSEIFDEIDLTDSSIAEKNTKKVNSSFSIIGPSYNLMLSASSRKDMDEWICAIKAVQSREFYSPHQIYMDNFSDGHNWYACTHNRPTYCNVCKEVLSGVMNHGLSCDVCKFKVHKRCASKATNNCKWTTLATVGKNVIENEDGLALPHQWLEGNLPVSAKCVVCERTCGSVLRMQDWRCLWCRTIVHTQCRKQLASKCPLGSCKMSILPPIAIHSQDSDDFWLASPSSMCSSPLLVFVNSKSGDNQGVKFLRRFRQYLNPAQVFDLVSTGPKIGLQMFRKFDIFRILICGGDGSVGWVLSELDKLNLSAKAQVGVLPLGTGNDLAQVMGWGNMCDDDALVPSIIEKYERASARLLDRWSILTYEGKLPLTLPPPPPVASSPAGEEHDALKSPMTGFEDTVADHLGTLLSSDHTTKVVSSATVLCETVKDFVNKVGRTYTNDDSSDIPAKCRVLEEKLASLLDTLTLESKMAELEHANGNSHFLPSACPNDPVANKDSSYHEPQDPWIMQDKEKWSKADEDASEVENKNKLFEFDSPAVCNVTSGSLETVPEVMALGKIDVETSKAKRTNNEDVPCTSKSPQKKAPKQRMFEQRSQLMLRANSLKKAVRQIIEHTENAVDEQNEQTKQCNLPHIITTLSPPAGEPRVDDDIKSCGDGQLFSRSISNSFQSLRPPTSEVKSKSAPSTPTSTLGHSFIKKYARQSSTNTSFANTQKNPSTTVGLFPLSKFQKSSTAINPLYNPNQKSTFLGRVLLANADTLCAPATPMIHTDDSVFRSLFAEKCVMNNYFGIGLDAKISLDFHKKREDNPKKCSRTKNRVWYGMLATKEIAMKTYKNLEQRIRLECDGQYVALPPLQGIVVLNIASYAGGNNFWGSRSGNEIFMAPSYNDKILEIVAVFSTVQLGMALVVPDGVGLQHHRIAQCKSVKITILGEEAVPLQADGEAWLQPPGIIKIEHKNRVQMLARDRRLEVALKTWEIKHKYGADRSQPNAELLTDSEVFMIGQLAETATAIALSLTESESRNNFFKEELLPLASTILRLNSKLRPLARVSHTASRQLVAEFVMVVRDFKTQLESVIDRKANELERAVLVKAENWLEWLEMETKKIKQIKWLLQVEQPQTEQSQPELHPSKVRASARFKLFRKTKKEDTTVATLNPDVSKWSLSDVGAWLASNDLHSFRQIFINHEIGGRKLLSLEENTLKSMDITKHDHVKRILSRIKDLQK